MSTDFSQSQLDSPITIGQQELTAAKQKIQELQVQVDFYEKREVEHKDLETHMRNSYRSFTRDLDELKKNLAIAELRNQELKEENIKMKAQLSGKIDLLLKERQELMNSNENWFQADRPTTVFTGYICTKFEKIEIQIDTEENKISHVRGINLLP